MPLFMVQNKKTKEIIGFYPHFALISFTNENRQPIDSKKYYTLTPVKNVIRTTNMNVVFSAEKKNQNWQDRVWQHFENKYEERTYQNGDSWYTWYDDIELPYSKHYQEVHQTEPKRRWHNYHRKPKSHSAWGWRHVRNYNRKTNFAYNQYVNYPKMRHKNRHLQDQFDFEHWRGSFSTGWKNKKKRHQYMVHWR